MITVVDANESEPAGLLHEQPGARSPRRAVGHVYAAAQRELAPQRRPTGIERPAGVAREPQDAFPSGRIRGSYVTARPFSASHGGDAGPCRRPPTPSRHEAEAAHVGEPAAVLGERRLPVGTNRRLAAVAGEPVVRAAARSRPRSSDRRRLVVEEQQFRPGSRSSSRAGGSSGRRQARIEAAT
jgi:hypothetical protein